ncbi:hypothetical protein Nepgr_033743 [Nepenthes gracilis]|uniref:Uncharacterized protein n=1 Tax=Nepenthes gracilis TaxID=150966 RepID=A0AAD3TMC9_NEPGR|nr:hypothetical protein Nepgr_033743 [Nepenthes gracilis]
MHEVKLRHMVLVFVGCIFHVGAQCYLVSPKALCPDLQITSVDIVASDICIWAPVGCFFLLQLPCRYVGFPLLCSSMSRDATVAVGCWFGMQSLNEVDGATFCSLKPFFGVRWLLSCCLTLVAGWLI